MSLPCLPCPVIMLCPRDQVLDVDKAASLNHSLVNHIQGVGRAQTGGGGCSRCFKNKSYLWRTHGEIRKTHILLRYWITEKREPNNWSGYKTTKTKRPITKRPMKHNAQYNKRPNYKTPNVTKRPKQQKTKIKKPPKFRKTIKIVRGLVLPPLKC